MTELFVLQNKISNPKKDLTGFQNLTGLSIFKKWLVQYQLRKSQTSSKTIKDLILIEPEYKQQVKQIKNSLIDWLTNNIQHEVNFPDQGLNKLPEIVLGMLFTSSCTTENPETILAEWKQNQPWNGSNAIDFLQTTLSATNWQKLIIEDQDRPNKPLNFWKITDRKNIQNLKIKWEVFNRSQPEINNWLQELNGDNADNLIKQLKDAWDNAIQQLESYQNSKFILKITDKGNHLTVLQAIILV